MEVVFSHRAFAALLAETYEKIKTETGGVFLGFYEENKCYIVETIDPGPNSIFEPLYFEYDQKYVSHLINKAARIYKRNLFLVGLWHRHPGSFDVFSGTDDGTNTRFARLNKGLTVSMLVNIDPSFRLTVYQVKLPLNYQKINYKVGDDFFPPKSLDLWDQNVLIDKINNPDSQAWINHYERVAKKHFDEIIWKAIRNISPVNISELENQTEENIDALLDSIYSDLEFISNLSEEKVTVSKRGGVSLDIRTAFDSVSFYVYNGKTYFSYKDKCFEYENGLIEKLYKLPKRSIDNVLSGDEVVEKPFDEEEKKEEKIHGKNQILDSIRNFFFKNKE